MDSRLSGMGRPRWWKRSSAGNCLERWRACFSVSRPESAWVSWLSSWVGLWNGRSREKGTKERQQMVIIDRLCYNSKLRYVNAGEKFAFSVLTLIACVISRSIRISLPGSDHDRGSHRMEGGDPCFPVISSAADDSSGLPDFKHPCHCAESFGDADGSLCGSHRQRVFLRAAGIPLPMP